MTTHGLTGPLRDTLNFIRAYIARNGTSPSYDEIRVHLGHASKSCASRLVQELVDRGHITKLDRKSRSIALTAPSQNGTFKLVDEKLQAQLSVYCLATGQTPDAVIHDAVALFLDAETKEQGEVASCQPA